MKRVVLYLSLFGLTACSQYNHGFLSRSWHDINSKFNALLIAREDLVVAKEYLAKNFKENYEETLPIFAITDSTQMDTAKYYLVDVIKKSSIIAEKHSNSKHLDEAYLLIGEARILKGEYENAIETYKYLNTVSQSESAKTRALSEMLRAYVALKDFRNAEQLASILKNRNLDKESRKTYLLNLAYFNQARGEEAVAAVLLEEALKFFKKGEEKARLHFILAQLYTYLDQATLARKNYRLVSKNKPSYDLQFNSELGLLMTESLAKNTQIDFDKMLTNRKNQDLKHKVYFKMGESAWMKGNLDLAILNYQKSIQEAALVNEPLAKGIAYKAIGDIYLEELTDYDNAAVYYDSTVITLPKDYLKQTEISEKASYLNEFLRYRKVYNFEDSLQRLASLSPEVLEYTIEKEILKTREEEKNKKKKEEIVVAEIASQQVQRGSRWRLYDPVLVVREKNEFVRLWGSRTLEDNWRRREKSTSTFVFDDTEMKMVEKIIEPDASSQNSTESQITTALQTEAQELENEKRAIKEAVREFKNRIPLSKVQMIASKRKQEEAAFRIAKIYKLQFKEEDKAKQAFEKFLEEFPQSTYEPEVLYYLALSSETPQETKYAEKLAKDYPNTSFGRQIKMGSVNMTKDLEDEAIKSYEHAYKLYNLEKYQESIAYLESALDKYLGSPIEDKMALLRIMALAKVGSKDEYQIALNDFIRSFPSSDFIPKAKELLSVLK